MLPHHEFLQRTVRALGGNVGFVSGEVRKTYRVLFGETARLARGLAGRGVPPGERFAVLLRNCHAYFTSYFAASMLGATVHDGTSQ